MTRRRKKSCGSKKPNQRRRGHVTPSRNPKIPAWMQGGGASAGNSFMYQRR